MLFLFSPHGRMSRRGFWLGFVLLWAVLVTGAFFLDEHLTRAGPIELAAPFDGYAWAMEMIGGPAQTVVLLLFPFSLAPVTIKRLHDTGHGVLMLVWKLLATAGLGWLAGDAAAIATAQRWSDWAGFTLAAAAGLLIALLWIRVLVLAAAVAGEIGENRFGPDPLQR